MEYQNVRSKIIVRTKLKGEAQKDPPQIIQVLKSYYAAMCAKLGTKFIGFVMDGLPMSVNHMYERVAYKKAAAKGGGIGVTTFRKKEVDDFRINLADAMGDQRFHWQPKGITAAIIMLESPHWITQKREVAQMDADNRVKVILDAVEFATHAPDELYWDLHVFKVVSKRVRTSVWLFDLGDVVEYYY